MNRLKKLGKALLFPPMAIAFALVPVATALLVHSLTGLEADAPLAIVSYVLSFYTLTVWCARIPQIIALFKRFKRENKYVRIWTEDVRLRVRLSLYGTFVWNAAYAALQLGLGLYHKSVWYYALAVYYFCLAIMRFFLSRHLTRHKPGQQRKKELLEYRACGWVFLVINLAISAMVALMIYQNKATRHHEITTIALAAYTFTTFTVAIINAIRFRKYNSPVYSASKAISLTAAGVSMITLTSTMLTSFAEENSDSMLRPIMLAGLGAAVSVFITAMAVFMIVRANKELGELE